MCESALPDLFRCGDLKITTAKYIYYFVYDLFVSTQLEPEVLLAAIVLFARLMQRYNVTRHTLRGALVTCVMLESKVNDDRSMKLPSFAR